MSEGSDNARKKTSAVTFPGICGAELLQSARDAGVDVDSYRVPPPALRTVPSDRLDELRAFAAAWEQHDDRTLVTPVTCEEHGVYLAGWGWYPSCPRCSEQPEPLMELLEDPLCWPGHGFYWVDWRGPRGRWVFGESFPVRRQYFARLAELLPDMDPGEVILESAAKEIERQREVADNLRQLLRLAVLRMREAADQWDRWERDSALAPLALDQDVDDAMNELIRAVRFQLPAADDLLPAKSRNVEELLRQPGFAFGEPYPATGDPPTTANAWNELLELARKVPAWIPVADRLPEPDVEVLILTDGQRRVAKLEAGDRVRFVRNDGESPSSCLGGELVKHATVFLGVTHWMPLPEAAP